MIDSLPAAPDPASDVPAVFNTKAAAFVLAQKAMVDQINATTANLNSIAMGGGFAIPYIFNPDDLTKVDGRISVTDPSSQATTTNLFVNRISTNGINYSPILNEFAASTSVLKGYARVVKQGDPSKFLVFAILAVGTYDRYFQFSGVVIQGSQTNPFSYTDSVLLTFTRTGDKGETGTYPQMLIRDQQASGAAAMSFPAAGWYTRRFNFVGVNDIAGASLSGNIVTFNIGGRFLVNGYALGYQTNFHNIRLWNVATGQLLDVGSNAYAASGSVTLSVSSMTSIVTVAAGAQLRMDHFVNAAGSGGTPVSNGVAEQYAEMRITKLS